MITGPEGGQKVEGGKEHLRSAISRENSLPVKPPGHNAPPLPNPLVPLVSINETAFSLQKETATPAVASLEIPHHQRILKESCKGACFDSLFNVIFAIILSTLPCSFTAKAAANPRLALFLNSRCSEQSASLNPALPASRH